MIIANVNRPHPKATYWEGCIFNTLTGKAQYIVSDTGICEQEIKEAIHIRCKDAMFVTYREYRNAIERYNE